VLPVKGIFLQAVLFTKDIVGIVVSIVKLVVIGDVF